MNELVDMTGSQAGGVLVVRRDGHRAGRPAWLCLCSCGAEFQATGAQLRRAKTKGCSSCTNKRAINVATIHGGTGKCEYVNWTAMKGRCYNPNDRRFSKYGGRGIRVCARWLQSFASFLEDMGRKPSADHSIERIDRDGDYCPENCAWANRFEQANNRSNNTRIEIGGRTQNLTQWSREAGIHRTVIMRRMKRGFSGEALIKKGILK